jgi:HAD superfamily hydrolase (TIGR01458 family)
MPDLGQIEALMFDLDGVIFVGDEPIAGSVEAVKAIERRGIITRFVTNTTTRPRRLLMDKLAGLGLEISAEQLFTPAALARRAMERAGAITYRLMAPPELAEDLGPGRIAAGDTATPDWVVMGLHTPFFNHQALTTALGDLLAGARLMALHKNRIWRTSRGLELGLGGYVSALEHGAGIEAVVIGKPSAAFFKEALDDIGKPLSRVAMVGDDIESDVGGARAAGVSGILVRTGKFTPRSLELSDVEPDLIVDDAADLARRICPDFRLP